MFRVHDGPPAYNVNLVHFMVGMDHQVLSIVIFTSDPEWEDFHPRKVLTAGLSHGGPRATLGGLPNEIKALVVASLARDSVL